MDNYQALNFASANYCWLAAWLLQCVYFFIHRRLATIRLPVSGTNLFPMAGVPPPSVIYYIIAAQMETSHTINIDRNSSNIRSGIRLALTVVGIVAAIICFFTLLSEVRSSADAATVPHGVEVFKMVPGDFVVGVASVNFVSALWPF